MQQLFDFIHSKKMDYIEYFLNFVFFIWCVYAWLYNYYSPFINLSIAIVLVISVLTTIFKKQIVRWFTIKIKLKFIRKNS